MGGVLVLEAATVPLHGTRGAERSAGEPGSRAGGGSLRCTGRLGEVIQESAELAFTWVKAHAVELGVQDAMRGVDVHVGPIYLFSCQSRRNVKLMFQLHLPSGSIKKDGPSAGIAMVMAFVSLLSDRAVPPTTAMTGEITLRGLVTPVGGIKEKVLGAHRAGIKRYVCLLLTCPGTVGPRLP
jgi:ATP-dependent Lon protease